MMDKILFRLKKRTALSVLPIYVCLEVFFLPPVYPATSQGRSLPLERQRNHIQQDLVHFVFVDSESKSFGVFEQGPRETPLVFGKVLDHAGEQVFIPSRKINTMDSLYVLTDPLNPDFLEVMERLPNGGFGRLLRYRGFIGHLHWIDIEFLYQDKENCFTILDYASGRFFRMALTEDRGDSSFLFPLNDSWKREEGLAIIESSISKSYLQGAGKIHHLPTNVLRIYSQFDDPSGMKLWAKHLVRGPPMEGCLT